MDEVEILCFRRLTGWKVDVVVAEGVEAAGGTLDADVKEETRAPKEGVAVGTGDPTGEDVVDMLEVET